MSSLITEDFSDKGIKLVDYEEVPLKEVSLRFTLPQRLNENGFVLKVTSPDGKLIVDKNYRASYENGRLFFETVAEEEKGSSARAKKVMLNLASDEGPVNREQEFIPPVTACPDLREIYPGHNRLGENRINLIFIGVGMDRDSQGRPEFVRKGLLDAIDYNGVGIKTVYYSPFYDATDSFNGYIKTSEKFFKGLFSFDPFLNNLHLFNFWYTNNIFPIKSNNNQKCYQFVDDDYDCDELSNTREIYLVKLLGEKKCRSTGALNKWYTFGYAGDSYNFAPDGRVVTLRFLHELGHSLGNLADEYVQSGEGNRPRYPNCLNPSNPFVPALRASFKVQTFVGCSYTNDNVRFSENSIMRLDSNKYSSNPIPDSGFATVSEAYICDEFRSLTGTVTLGVCNKNIPSGSRSYYRCNTNRDCVSGVCDLISVPQYNRPILQCLPTNLDNWFSCSVGSQCKSGLCKSLGQDRVCLPTGMARNEPGCIFDEQCENNLQCVSLTLGINRRLGAKKCQDPLSAGSVCFEHNDCQSNLCRDPEGDGTKNCLPINLPGLEACQVHEQCQSGSCITNQGGSGKICYAGTTTLPDGSRCNTDSECQSRICRYPTGFSTLTCLPANLAAGQSCHFSAQCQSFNCNNRICANQPQTNIPDGSLCNVNEDCQSGACITYPTRSICGNSNLANGEQCSRYTQCQSGNCELRPGGYFCAACTSDSQCPEPLGCFRGECS